MKQVRVRQHAFGYSVETFDRGNDVWVIMNTYATHKEAIEVAERIYMSEHDIIVWENGVLKVAPKAG